jgi:hypothetical protein
MQSLNRSADRELMGSFAGISASLVSFCRSTELPVYIAIAEALEGMYDDAELLSRGVEDSTPLSILLVKEVAARTLPPPSTASFTLAAQLVKGHASVEIPGLLSREGDIPSEPIYLPEPRPLSDDPLAPCKHERSLIKQARYVRQILEVFEAMDPVK